MKEKRTEVKSFAVRNGACLSVQDWSVFLGQQHLIKLHKKALTQHLYSFQLFKFHNFPVFHDLWNTWHFRKFSNPLLF